jgi:hypothetical protein
VVSIIAASSIAAYGRRGGVGDRRLTDFFFWLRGRDFLDKIEPAHDLTFFCFLPDFLETDDLRELEGSIEGIGGSAISVVAPRGVGIVGKASVSFSDIEETGRERFGDWSPADESFPKNDHFFLGLLGVLVLMSSNIGTEPRLFGQCSSSIIRGDSLGVSRIDPAVLGLESSDLRLGDGLSRLRCSLIGGL